MLERSTRRGCCRFATIANRSGGRLLSRPLSHIATWGAAVLIYLCREEVTANLAFKIDVTSHNLPPSSLRPIGILLRRSTRLQLRRHRMSPTSNDFSTG